MKSAACLLALSLLMPAPALAGEGWLFSNDAASDWQVGPVAGTLGVGAQLRWQADPYWSFRASLQGGYLPLTVHKPSADLENTFKLLNFSAIADWHPMGGNFYVSGGLVVSGSHYAGHVRNLKDHVVFFGRPGVVNIPDPLTRYDATFNPLQPYAGIGYSVKGNERMTLDIDLGATYAGVADLGVVSRADRLGFSDRQINREIRRAERQAERYQILPVVGFTFRFKF